MSLRISLLSVFDLNTDKSIREEIPACEREVIAKEFADYLLKTSLATHKIITIMYQKNQEITQRNIKVLKMNDKEIEAYCYLRKQIRHFKRENILSAGYIH